MAGEQPIGIGLLRPELLGTYGDSGNAVVLAQRLRWRGLAARIVQLGPGEAIPADVRVVVLGGGEDRALAALVEDRQLAANLHLAVARGVAVLGVCAGLQVLGRHFVGSDGRETRGVGLLDCATYRLDRRAVGECVVHIDDDRLTLDELVLTGFENHQGGTIVGPDSLPLGRIRAGVGNGNGTDGAVSGRVIGTYLHGPVLARNPQLADRLLESVVGPLDPLPMDQVDELRVERTSAAFRGRATDRARGLAALKGWRRSSRPE